MVRHSTLRRAVLGLLTAAVVLFITLAVLLGLGRVLTAMGDAAGGLTVDRIALGCGVLLVVDLVSLVLLLAIASLSESRIGSGEDRGEDG
jgi:hypothetical protein